MDQTLQVSGWWMMGGRLCLIGAFSLVFFSNVLAWFWGRVAGGFLLVACSSFSLLLRMNIGYYARNQLQMHARPFFLQQVFLMVTHIYEFPKPLGNISLLAKRHDLRREVFFSRRMYSVFFSGFLHHSVLCNLRRRVRDARPHKPTNSKLAIRSHHTTKPQFSPQSWYLGAGKGISIPIRVIRRTNTPHQLLLPRLIRKIPPHLISVFLGLQ